MYSYSRIVSLFFIFIFFKINFLYAQSPNNILSVVYKVIRVGEWISKITINNQKVKVFYIKVETTAPTFDQAKEAGFKLAIQEALGTFVLNEKVVKFQDVVRDDIVMYSGGYVQDFKIIEEKINLSSTTLVMDVWVSESKIADRLLNTSVNKSEVEGKKIAAQLSTIVKDKNDGFKLLQLILNDFPSKSFELKIDKTNFQILRDGTTVLQIPIEISWSQKYLDSLKETLLLLRDGDELRSNMFGRLNSNNIRTISISSGMYGHFDASFNDDEKMDLFYQHFNKIPLIKISLNDDFENEKLVGCFYLQSSSGNFFTTSRFGLNYYVTLSIDEKFYEFNTNRAHFEINEKYQLKKIFPIDLYHRDLNKVLELSKISASIIENEKECKSNVFNYYTK